MKTLVAYGYRGA